MAIFTKSLWLLHFKKLYVLYGFINSIKLYLYPILVYYSHYLDEKYLFLTDFKKKIFGKIYKQKMVNIYVLVADIKPFQFNLTKKIVRDF